MHRVNRVVGQPILGLEDRELPVVIAAQALVGTNPKTTFTVLADHANGIARQAVSNRMAGEHAIPEPAKPASVPSNPQVPFVIGKDCPDPAFDRKSFLGSVRNELSFLEHTHAGGQARTHPQVAAPVLLDGPDKKAPQSLLPGKVCEVAVAISAHAAAVRAHPDVASSIFQHAFCEIMREPFPRCEVGELAVAQPGESAAARADPQTAFTIFVKRINVIVG